MPAYANARTEGINRLIRHVKLLGFRNSANDVEYGSTAPGIESPASNTGIKIIARSELKSRYAGDAGDADPAKHDLEWLHSLATALNTSSFAARLLGGTAAMMPAMNASTTTTARLVTGSRNTVSP